MRLAVGLSLALSFTDRRRRDRLRVGPSQAPSRCYDDHAKKTFVCVALGYLNVDRVEFAPTFGRGLTEELAIKR